MEAKETQIQSTIMYSTKQQNRHTTIRTTSNTTIVVIREKTNKLQGQGEQPVSLLRQKLAKKVVQTFQHSNTPSTRLLTI